MFIAMKKYILSFLTLIILFIPILKAQIDVDLRAKFEHAEDLKHHFYGFSLYDADSGRFIFGINEEKHLMPASNTKIFTVLAALHILSDSIPGLQYVERGDSLIFWGTGDPTFLHNRLDSHKVYDFLKRSGKQLYYVSTQAKEPFYRNGWAMEDYDEYYQPELSSFPIYGNVATFRAPQSGSLSVVPNFFQEHIHVREQRSNRANFTLSRKFDTNVFEMSSIDVKRGYVNEKPFKYSDSLFLQLLVDTLKKEVNMIDYEKPSDTHILYSNSRNEMLREMMLPSDNFMAEQFQMMCSFVKYGEFDTRRIRSDMQQEYYTHFTDKIDLQDGSGLSIYNLVTPRSVVELLALLQSKIPEEGVLHRLFPTGGVDGTIKSAYELDQGQPFVWAKTGTLNSAYCQSGYIITRSGRRLIFSFLNNNFVTAPRTIRKEMVAIITHIRQNY